MPKQAFPAAAEGMPRINRRTILGGIAAAPVVALPVVATALEATPSGQDQFSAERVDQLIKCALLFGCLSPEERQIALMEMKEIARQRRGQK